MLHRESYSYSHAPALASAEHSHGRRGSARAARRQAEHAGLRDRARRQPDRPRAAHAGR